MMANLNGGATKWLPVASGYLMARRHFVLASNNTIQRFSMADSMLE